MRGFTLFLLWSSVLAFFAIALFFLIAPEYAAGLIGVQGQNSTGRTDIRATYGGMLLGLSILFGWAALSNARFEAGLWALLCVYGGLAFGRGLAILLGERPGQSMYVFLLVEVAYAVATFIALRKQSQINA